MANKKMMIGIASDHAGVELKQKLVSYLHEHGYEVADLGPQEDVTVDYPDYGHGLARWLVAQQEARGILVCGSGIGMSIAANRHAGIRAALCADASWAELARKHNGANVLCLGARMIDEAGAKECVKRFLETEFEGGRHEARVKKLG